jgi:hypothetical protein
MTPEAKEVMLQSKLSAIQKELKAPKNLYSEFGNYNYRSCEDILNALKPLLGGSVILLTDEIVMLGERYYVKATATLMEGQESISTTAYAREALAKTKMDDAQVTGAASSYARKYALNGLFAIDDTKDADGMKPEPRPTTRPAPQQPKPAESRPTTAGKITEPQRRAIFAISRQLGMTDEALKDKFKIESTKDLTSQQASAIIEELKRMNGEA